MEIVFQFITNQSTFYLAGFSTCYLILFLIGKSKSFQLFETSYKVIPIAGLIIVLDYFIYILYSVFIQWYNGYEYEQYSFLIPFGENYLSLIIFLKTLYVLIPTQLFWIKKVRKMKYLVALLGLFFIISFERVYIFVRTFYRDYLPSSWTMYTGNIFITLFYEIILFLVITYTLNFILKNKKNLNAN